MLPKSVSGLATVNSLVKWEWGKGDEGKGGMEDII